jgi:hypothetical protein
MAVTPAGQLVLQGQQTMGWASGPYMAMIQFTNITPAALAGFSGAGERVAWIRIA